MGYILCIAEKHSVAQDIARILSATVKKDGYCEGNGYVVTWAVGHLVALAEPEEYGYVAHEDVYKNKSDIAMAELPLIPKQYKYNVIETSAKQFNVIKQLMLSKDCDVVYNYGDAGTEGELIQYLIRKQVGYKGKTMRAYLTSLTDEAIKDSLKHLRPQEEFKNVIEGALCRSRADWILGMSMSRAESIKYSANVSVGRVQTPTLYFIVKRFMDVTNFKVTNYYGMELKLKEGFSAFWNIDKDGLFSNSVKDAENRVLDENSVMASARKIIQEGTGKVILCETKRSGNNRPQLYDITELQRDANKKYGYSPSLTLACAQCLYESHKVTSYPRTDSRFITTDLEPYMADRVRMVSTVVNGNKYYKECAEAVLKKGLNIDGKIVDNSKVTDHHAIIPTERINGFDMSSLCPVTDKDKKEGVTKENLTNVLDLILTRTIIAFCQPCVFDKTSIVIETPSGFKFSASGKIIIDNGWKDFQDKLSGKEEEEKNEEADEEQNLPKLRLGQLVSVNDCFIKAKKTTPPKLHTEATLLTAMETAGKGEKGGEILKGKGIGTQATRASVIKELFDKKYCTYQKKGKVQYIVPTKNGINVIQVVPRELYSPMITADWESKIALISEGKMSADTFMSEFEKFIVEKVDEVRESTLEVKFDSGREPKCKCPWCGKNMYRYDTKDKNDKKCFRIYCEDKSCGCALTSTNPLVETTTGKALTEKQMIDLLTNGKIITKCKSMYGNGTYDGGFMIEKQMYKDKPCVNVKFFKVEKKTSGKKKRTGGAKIF